TGILESWGRPLQPVVTMKKLDKLAHPRALGPKGPERPWSLYVSNAPESEFGYYGSGFHEAARRLARSITRRRGRRGADVLPLLFLYRHSIELLAKAVVLSGNRFMQVVGDGRDESEVLASFRRSRHRLLPLLAQIRKILEFSHFEWFFPGSAVETFADVQRVFEELDILDSDACTFRYPINVLGERSTPSDLELGLKTMVAVLDDLAEALDTVVFALDAKSSTLA
ncbi:MAG TPA: hypothetical protein VN970_07630, partial [Thermoanaerobaculia bacterium]|nr:hypothetical protein [Thermoanaerobaculia bacterium]